MRPIDRLLGVMERLRDPDGGCPWDVEQTFATIAPYTVEEAYEVADAIERSFDDDSDDPDVPPHLVVSAGFMKILGATTLARHTVINTHPALLPSFPGAHGVRDALAHGVKITGTTCHVVDAGVDTGPIIAQRAVEVRADDDEDSLHERIKVEERTMLVDVVRGFARGWSINGRTVSINE